MKEMKKTDAELQAIADSYNESELFGSQMALFPGAKTPDDMTRYDYSRLMELCKEVSSKK